RRARAVILSRLRYAVALLRVAVVRRKRRRRQHENAAHGCSENRGLRGHVSSLLWLVKYPGRAAMRDSARSAGARVVPFESSMEFHAVTPRRSRTSARRR